MDKAYYYRLLGLTGEATQAQVKAAYEMRMAKLDSPDYSDDPEYVTRKKQQVTEAYRVLTGAMPPIGSKGRMRVDLQRGHQHKTANCEAPFETGGVGTPKNTVKNLKGVLNNKFVVPIIIVIAVSVISVVGAIIGAIGSVIGGFVSGFPFDFDTSYEDEMPVDSIHDIDNAQVWAQQFDYTEALDIAAIGDNSAYVDWTRGVDEYADGDTFEYTLEVLYCLDIYDAGGFFDYITAEKDFYFENDDYDCAEMLISWLGAPPFEAVAGSTSVYTGKPILTIAEYMDYLRTFIDERI